MAQKQQTTKKNTNQTTVAKNQSSYSAVIERMNQIANTYGNLPMDNIYAAFGRAAQGWANFAPVQNSRLKAIGTLPADYDKQALGEFLRNPQNSERPLRQIAEGLKWSTYSFYKLQKSYPDILSFRNYAIPQYITEDEIKSENFKREHKLVDKILKAIDIKSFGHKVAGEAMINGKVFYVPRYSVDKSHNKVNYFFLQRLPQNWTLLSGLNSISGYTVSFDLNYFLQIGTDFRQFGDLFVPYMGLFDEWQRDKKPIKKKYIYASHNNTENCEYELKAYAQNGRWYYWVTLPIDKIWVYEIDDTTPIVASPLSGLMQTFAQQADYEAAQLSLILNPLIKIFTGEIPYYQSNSARDDDGLRLSLSLRAVFEGYWNALMAQTNTSGTAFYTAPVENIRSHDYAESANANQISQSFLTYGMSKTGLSGIVPITDRPTQGTAEISAKLEAKYPQCIYRTLEKMINYLLDSLNLQYDWRVHIFGDIYSDEITRANALKELDKGDLSQYFILAALNDQSVLDKLAMCDVVKGVGLLDRLQVPQTAYTQSGKSQPKSDTGGSPRKDEIDKIETKTEKQVEVTNNV